MSDSEQRAQPLGNRLYWLCAAGGLLLGIFLLLGAYGHYEAVRLTLATEETGRQFALLVPGLLLAGTGLLDIVLCRFLWEGRPLALKLAIAGNLLALVYLCYLLWTGVPDHPVAIFATIVSCYLVLLAVTVFGPAWPAGRLPTDQSPAN